MRSYILTDKERTIIESFLETQEVPPEDYNHYHQLCHLIRKNISTISQDVVLIEVFMATRKTRP